MNPLVSVLLPVRNAAAHLGPSLESLLGQSFADYEITAVNDGSDDGGQTQAVLERYAAADPRLKIMRTGRQGVALALNLALQASCGAYLARMDADDVCHPDRLGLQASYLARHPEVDVVGCRVRFGGDGSASAGYLRHVTWLNTLLTHEQMALGAFRDAPLAHPSAMLRRASFMRYGAYRDGPFPEDYELWLRWLEQGARLAKLPQTLLTWNDPPTRLSRTDPRYHADAFFSVKAAYLARFLALNNPFHPEVTLVGAGRITRRRAEHLCAHGVVIKAYLDIDPRKIGQSFKGRPVLHHDQAPSPDSAYVVSYVSNPGAADHIRAMLESRGFRPGSGFLLAA